MAISDQKSVTLLDILTKAQIAHAMRLYKAQGVAAVEKIQIEVIEPNMAAINEKLGQENDARYLAYVVVYVLSEVEKAVLLHRRNGATCHHSLCGNHYAPGHCTGACGAR